MKETAFKLFCQEPYRLFFPLGMILGMIGAGHWLFYGIGWIDAYSAYFHSSLQTQAYMLCFVAGFLMTAMPRFSSAPPAGIREVLWVLGFILGNVTALSRGEYFIAQLCFSGVLIRLLLFIRQRIAKRKSPGVSPPLELIWIPFAVLHGLTGTLLMGVSFLNENLVFLRVPAKILSEQGFILCIVIGVGGFLAPRLMGTFRVYVKPGQRPDHPAVLRMRRGVLVSHLVAGSLFFYSFFLGIRHSQEASFLRACIVTAEYFWTCRFICYPKTPDLYARLLWGSLWMIVTGAWLVFLFPFYRTAMLHILFIGGFSLMIFSVATMVILSHGGAQEELRRPLPALWAAGAGVLTSLAGRLAAPFFPEQYFLLLACSSFVWILAACVWFFLMLPKIKVSLSCEELEQCHESAKQRVAELRGTADRQCCESKKI